jgi:hypothetical protein
VRAAICSFRIVAMAAEKTTTSRNRPIADPGSHRFAQSTKRA